MEIAHAVAQLSKDTSTKVGALIIGATNEVRSMGYNGAPRNCGADDVGDDRGLRPEKYFWFSHAEANAITNAARVGTPLLGSSIIVTHFPCMDCARLIVQSGITKVIVDPIPAEFYDRWKEHVDRAMKLFDECGVDVQILSPSSDQLADSEVSGCGNSEGGKSHE
jgi:dCMP deaminase